MQFFNERMNVMNDTNENNYKIYAHVNKINGKIYIGQTKQEPKKRWLCGHGYEQNQHFWNAIQIYGWHNFEHIVLIENLSLEIANLFEQELILKYKTYQREYGYNIQLGGNISGTMSSETKGKLSVQRMGGKNVHAKKVICLNTYEIFDSMADGGRKYNTTSSRISACCLGKVKSAGKHPITNELLHWAHYDGFDISRYNKEKYRNNSSSSIRCIETGEEFEKIIDATKVYNISRYMITKCCSGKVKYTKDKITGEILTWEYINKSVQNRLKKKVGDVLNDD